VTAGDVGKALTVTATATKSGFTTATRVSSAVTPVAGTFAVGAVTVSGKVSSGSRLSAAVADVPAGAEVSYSWLKGTAQIGTGATYLVAAGDMGASIRVRATVALPGYATVTKESAAVQVPKAKVFTDVPPTHTFASSIAWASATGITAGTGDGSTYSPSNPVNRGSMAAFLYRLAGSPQWTAPAKSPFVDVPTTHTFYSSITWLAKQGITVGTTINGKVYYQPGNAVNRGSMAAFMYRVAGKPEWKAPASSPFTDLPKTHTFYTSVTWLANEKITVGSTVGGKLVYQPSNAVNRGSMAAFMSRLVNGGLHCTPYPTAIGC